MKTTPTSETQVLIVGAGPTGLALALWLQRFGTSVRIIDQTPDAAPYSRALGVHARTLEFYRQLGLADAVVSGGVVMRGINLWVNRRKTAHLTLGDLGEDLTPYPFVLDFAQDDHERLLIDELAAGGTTIERRTRLVGLEHREHDVIATLECPDGSVDRCRATYVAGCDGAHSAVRSLTDIGFAGGSYERLFYVADVDATGPVVDGELHVDLGDADLLAIFAMKGDTHIRLVGTFPASAVAERKDLSFDDVSRRPIEQLGLEVRRVNWFSTYRVHHRVASTFRRGRTFLLGDAAHIHSPVGAQGMNTGIGDAVNLSWKLASVLGGSRSDLLDTYATERMAFARRLVATTDRAFTIATKPGRVAAVVRTRVFPSVVASLFKLPLFRRWLFRTVSQIEITYRDSALSEGRAGRVRGGDRLPWVDLDGRRRGMDNFAPLQSLDWQVHVYGKAEPYLDDVCRQANLALNEYAWTPTAARAGVARNAAYLVRPDGYVGLAAESNAGPRLMEYLRTCGIHLPEPARIRSESSAR
jgi:2-polyprenyl-6-methoxyphenol hydroxylase-like FAD-dependent oxidoreductase